MFNKVGKMQSVYVVSAEYSLELELKDRLI